MSNLTRAASRPADFPVGMPFATRFAMRWKTWASSCAAAGATLGQGVDPALACHEDPDIVGYEKSTSVGFMFGIAFGGGWRAIYGIDVRMSSGN